MEKNTVCHIKMYLKLKSILLLWSDLEFKKFGEFHMG